MKEYKIGEEFQFGRIKLRVEKCDYAISCENCFLKRLMDECYKLREAIGPCSEIERKDEQSVKFVKVEEDGKV